MHLVPVSACVGRKSENVWKQQEVEIQLSQQRLFHLTLCPCVIGNVNSELRLEGGERVLEPVATSTLGPPYVLFMNSRTHTLYKLYTLKPSKSPHTQGLRPGKLRTFWLYYSASAGNHHSVILIFLLYTSVKMQHVSALFKPPVRCDPRAQNLLISSNYSKQPIIGRGVRTRLHKKKVPLSKCWRCWAGSVNKNAVITGGRNELTGVNGGEFEGRSAKGEEREKKRSMEKMKRQRK